MPQKARGEDCLDFCMTKVLIGLLPRIFGLFFSSYRNYLRRGPVGLGQSHPLSEGRLERDREACLCWTEACATGLF